MDMWHIGGQHDDAGVGPLRRTLCVDRDGIVLCPRRDVQVDTLVAAVVPVQENRPRRELLEAHEHEFGPYARLRYRYRLILGATHESRLLFGHGLRIS